jgi:hypothetical protein
MLEVQTSPSSLTLPELIDNCLHHVKSLPGKREITGYILCYVMCKTVGKKVSIDFIV